MNRFRRSVGRVSLEILCALTISLSLAGAWQQTGAWALLLAALASLIGATILAADLRQANKILAPEPQRIDFESGLAIGSFDVAEGPSAIAAGEKAAPAREEKAGPKTRSARGRGPGRARKASGSKRGEAAMPAPKDSANPTVAPELPMAAETLPAAQEEAARLFTEEPQHPPVAPLFEPEPFVRQQRAVFGRKAG